MSVISTRSFVGTLTILTVVGANQLILGDPDPEYDCSYCLPEQIHIAFGEKINDIVVTWTTIDDAKESRVQFGPFHGPMNHETTGDRTKYNDLRGQWIHRVTLRDLSFNTTYKYRCGSRFAWSELFSFTTMPEEESVLRALVYGDMGMENAHALPYLQQEAENKTVDFILHVGDFAYDMDDHDSHVGDQFMRQIQPIAAIVPYMVGPGNHEDSKNFTQYKSRMTMPNYQQWDSIFYSWDIGPIHFVSINTEVYYLLLRFRSFFDNTILHNQWHWLMKDLETANLKENREKRPWIIIYGHRPMYCTASGLINFIECFHEPSRSGILVWESWWFPTVKYGLESMLMKYGVDIVIWAHEHMYERTWPVYDKKVYNGSSEQPYVNPKAPVHIITGSAGCKELPEEFGSQDTWSAFRSRDYGYTRFHAYNKTHVHFEQISVDLKGEVIDSFWVVQEHHGPFAV